MPDFASIPKDFTADVKELYINQDWKHGQEKKEEIIHKGSALWYGIEREKKLNKHGILSCWVTNYSLEKRNERKKKKERKKGYFFILIPETISVS